MFVATFQEVNNSGGQFTPDKNGNLPYIGNVRAGKALGTLINGTVFETQGFKVNKAYLCQNKPVDIDGTTYQNTEIVSELSALDTIQAVKELGSPVTVLQEQTENEHINANA